MAERFRGTDIMDPNHGDYVMGMEPEDVRTLGREVAQVTAALEAQKQEREAFDRLSPEAQMAAQARMWHERLGARDAAEAVQPNRNQPDADFNFGTHAEFQQNRVPETVVFENGAKNA